MLAELGIEHLGLFVLSGWLLNLTPGPDVLYIVSSALRSGVRAGIVAALGITAGCFVHIVAAGLGVSALMATSAMAFSVLKWVGAAYLLYVGVRLLLSKAQDAIKIGAVSADSVTAGGLKSLFFRGFWTNALNPKVALFFLAFVPQFIAPGTAHPGWVFAVLGLLFTFNGLLVCLGWALVAAWAARRAGALRRGMRWLDGVAGSLFIAFGVKLALTDAPVAR